MVLTALEGDPSSALAEAHEQLRNRRVFDRGNRSILALLTTARIALLANHPDDARPLVHEAMRLIAACAWPGSLRGAAEVSARLSAAEDPEAAAKLLAAAEARPPTHRWRMLTDRTATRASLEDALGREAFTAYLDEGAQLSFDEVVTLASRMSREHGSRADAQRRERFDRPRRCRRHPARNSSISVTSCSRDDGSATLT